GQCADMDAINGIGDRHGITVIEDAAQSFGATYKGRSSCALSTMAASSFFPAKPLGCYGDGRAVCVGNADLPTSIKELRNHAQHAPYHHLRLGINGRLDTLQAAVLLAKMEIFEDELRAREAVAARYGQLLAPYDKTPVLAQQCT